MERSKKGELVFAEKETDQNILINDCFLVAWKRKLKSKLTANIICHIPKEISWTESFFINQGGKVAGSVYSSQCFPSPIATRGLEVLIDRDFKIKALKLKLLERLKDIFERNYNEPIKASVQPIEYLDYLASEQEKKKKSRMMTSLMLHSLMTRKVNEDFKKHEKISKKCARVSFLIKLQALGLQLY